MKKLGSFILYAWVFAIWWLLWDAAFLLIDVTYTELGAIIMKAIILTLVLLTLIYWTFRKKTEDSESETEES